MAGAFSLALIETDSQWMAEMSVGVFFFVSFSVPIFVVVVFDFTFAIEQKSV